MNRRGFIDFDEINPAFIGLSLIGAIGVFFMMRAMGLFFRIFGTVLGFILVYVYLVYTDR